MSDMGWLVCGYGYLQTYKPHTLVGPTVTKQVQDPLAVLRLKNQLYIAPC